MTKKDEIFELKLAEKLLKRNTDKDGKCALDKNQEKIIADSVSAKKDEKENGSGKGKK